MLDKQLNSAVYITNQKPIEQHSQPQGEEDVGDEAIKYDITDMLTNMVVSKANSIGYEAEPSQSPVIKSEVKDDDADQFEYQTIQSPLVRLSLQSHKNVRTSDISQNEANIEHTAVSDISPGLDILSSPQIRTKEGLEERKAKKHTSLQQMPIRPSRLESDDEVIRKPQILSEDLDLTPRQIKSQALQFDIDFNRMIDEQNLESARRSTTIEKMREERKAEIDIMEKEAELKNLALKFESDRNFMLLQMKSLQNQVDKLNKEEKQRQTEK